MNNNSLQKVEIKKVTETPFKIKIFNREVKYLKVKDVKRAYSRLIQEYCKGTLNGDEARTLAYLFSGYLMVIKETEFENRLTELEKKARVDL
jgi:hypothetical protein